MANKKIQLTYLWADESVLLEDLTKKISEKMTAWGKTFYQRYGFELDVEPAPLAQKSVARLSQYVLTKSNGIAPDLRDRDDVMEEYDRRIAEWGRQLTAKMEEWNKALEELHRAVIPSPAFDAALAKVQRISGEYDQILKQRDKVQAEKDAKQEGLRGEFELRRQMAVKRKKDSIGSDLRLSAHELIHAAGHLHPLMILEGVQKRVTHVTLPRGSLMGFPFSDLDIPIETIKTKRIAPGYFDGHANDIMNYTLGEDAGPEVCILSDRDKKLLDSAFFVAP